MQKLILLFMILAFIGCHQKDDASLVTGTVKDWHDNGQLGYVATLKDGKKDGIYKVWHENGQLRYEWNYKYGKKDGRSIESSKKSTKSQQSGFTAIEAKINLRTMTTRIFRKYFVFQD